MTSSQIGRRNDQFLTFERANELLELDRETGVLTWPVNPRFGPKRAGAVAGSYCRNNYLQVKIDGRYHYAHRLVRLLVDEKWPAGEIDDHVDGNPANNAPANLREATRSENLQNKVSVRSSTSRYLGVYWNTRDGKWRAEITLRGLRK